MFAFPFAPLAPKSLTAVSKCGTDPIYEMKVTDGISRLMLPGANQ